MSLPMPSTNQIASLEFTNARIVTPTEIVHGTLRVDGETIVSVEQGGRASPAAIDCNGDYLLPGLIDVHTDHIEKHAVPRPRVFWPTTSAILNYDAAIISAGVTTVFDSLCVGAAGKPFRKRILPELIQGLHATGAAGLLKAEHLLHLRCDLFDPDLEEDLESFIDDPSLRFITLMDDSAPRRSDDYYRRVQRERGETDAEEIENRLQASHANDPTTAARIRPWIVKLARERGIVVANHDDASAGHVKEAVELGISLIEFAITEEAAVAAHGAGMTVIAGGANVVNGGSHFGGVSAEDLVRRGIASILCSDYVPASLLQAVFRIAGNDGGPSLSEAVALVTANPAKTFGLDDRGAISAGKRADIVRVSTFDGEPLVSSVWRQGRQVF
ncbi:alpha-D-ribose 1-methylphosphonate 5-triphosphate diphosphatase [Phyllobacterium sophorae]|uniref:Alpha-D-ribose 1-methylphosphonate 5-triphosphate diphosphatase n=1 Tax=Phyllobacterium sophorae TaxID=1520277 RepID=A0A2P7AQJ8_9HYPH|nr:alpha-D-ribose 1-methylphosphonate 5-triphosphate diphosphatase [Phyllobacterium sophorae]PSH56501.1 alpha-D-ribose 1-methylphosphonate 5-triphosphate diphosphatase [Phyllobacterium sophorae]